jgi:hypothetical protein
MMKYQGPRSTLLPLNKTPPASFPKAHPPYAPIKIVIGHFCHSLSQSNGIGTAPTQAPKQAPNAAPNTSSTGNAKAAIAFHFSVSIPFTYIRGRAERRARCAAQRRVWGRFVVKGAPKRIRAVVRMGVPKVRERIREMSAGYILLVSIFFYRRIH